MRHPIQGLRYRLGIQKEQGIPKRMLKRHLPRDAVIIEAGAHTGTDTLQFSRFWAEGHIHAFEPVPASYSQLARTVQGRANVTCYPLALGSEVTDKQMFVSSNAPAASSLLRPTGHLEIVPGATFAETATVSVTTIEAWARDTGVDRIDGMWLDLQGGELAALERAGPLLDTTRAIVLEVSYTDLYEGAPLWPEVKGWLEGRGFTIEARQGEHSAFGDALAVRH